MQNKTHSVRGLFFLILMVCFLGQGRILFAETVPMLNSGNNQSGIKASLVCMMNNKYMGAEQIPVQVGSKTYFGCCQGCASTIQNNPAVRYAKDPYTGKDVDKATAFIAKKSEATNKEKK